MKLLLLLSIILFSCNTFASGAICPEIKSKGEGHWPLSEDSFTGEAADKAIKDLSGLVNMNIIEADDFISKQENAFIIIKGFMLMKQISEYEKTGKKSYFARKQFCDFIKNEAHVWH